MFHFNGQVRFNAGYRRQDMIQDLLCPRILSELSARLYAFVNGLLFFRESDRPGIETVISADHLELTGINFGFENRRG